MYALQFVNAGLRSGERVLMLTHVRREDLLAHAESLGIELREAIQENRAVVVRYRTDFARRLARAGTVDRALDDLRDLIREHGPQRLAIDPFAPLLEDGSASPLAASSLGELLELSETTTLLTYSEDLANGYDSRLVPLVHALSGVFHITRDANNARTLEIVSLRDATAHGTRIPLAAPALPNESLVAPTGPFVLLPVTDSPAEELVATLRLQHEVVVRHNEQSDDVAQAAALIIETDHATLDRARELVRSRERAGTRAPLVVVSRFNLRSLDRARLLRDGADEVLAGDMGAPELLQRLAVAVHRGHLDRPPVAVQEDEGLTQASLAGPGQLLDAALFSSALRQRTAHDDAVPFAVIRLTIQNGDARALQALAPLVLGGMRAAAGDLAAMLDDCIAVYLHGAGRRDVAPFVDRLRGRRPPGAPALRVISAHFSSDGAALRQLVEPSKVS